MPENNGSPLIESRTIFFLPLPSLIQFEVDFLKQFFISFSGLGQGKHSFVFEIGEDFFRELKSTEISEAQLKAKVELDKKSTMLELSFHISGTVNCLCDTCATPFDLPLECNDKLIVKFGEEDYENTEEIIVLPYGEHELNIAQPLYEFIHLALPAKRVHPEGMCNEEMLRRIEELKPSVSEGQNDPRWDELKKLRLN